jgi:hypothetical protein
MLMESKPSITYLPAHLINFSALCPALPAMPNTLGGADFLIAFSSRYLYKPMQAPPFAS